MDILGSAAVRPDAGTDQRVLRAEAQVASLQSQLAGLQTQLARLEAERAALWWAVGHDELTGLPNRRLFSQIAADVLDTDGQAAAVVVLDLDGFKPINDTFGHHAGDEVLRIVARRLATHVSVVARLGGDEFAAILTNLHAADGPWWNAAIAALAVDLAAPMRVAGRTLTVTASIGVVPVPGPAPIGDLLRCADLAMYRAKAAGQYASVWVAEAPHGDGTAHGPRRRSVGRHRDPHREPGAFQFFRSPATAP